MRTSFGRIFPWLFYLVFTVIALGNLLFVFFAPCSWYAYFRVISIPGRCIAELSNKP